MAPLPVHIKHAGKVYDVHLDPDQPPMAFKEAVYQATGVPPDRMKVMIKGGMLKDDTDWAKVAPKAGQTFTVIGAAGELPKPPEKPIVFLEDMNDSELAEAIAMPVGLRNLGNTCYMNATVQAMRAIPELQTALNASPIQAPLPRALQNLFNDMSKTTGNVVPFTFLQILRQVVPQFAELSQSREFATYAQQDAEECWTQLTNALKDVPGLPTPTSTDVPEVVPAAKRFVEQYMMGAMRHEWRCDENPEEEVSSSVESVLKIECNISITTNYMHTGIMDALDQKVEKNSPSLGRQAVYTQKSRLTRLPAYLSVHMVRFMWRPDINKKAKIMRKVKFPLEFDALDLVSDELKQKMIPASQRLKEIEKDRAERMKIRKRTKGAASAGSSKGKDVEMADGATAQEESKSTQTGESSQLVTGGDLEDESVYREKEIQELEGLVSPDLKADIGCSLAGLYDLVAIVTHKGAAADSGHYIGFVKKSVFHPGTADGEDWYKFDDDKVSIFPKEKLGTLDGGGEDSAAYVLLYRSKPLD